MRTTTIEPAGLTNEELLTHVKQLVARDRVHLVELLLHLGELDARQAYLADGAPSLFRWCTGVIHLSEAGAFTRIRAARVGRRFPLVLERLRSGDIHLNAISRLAPHLTIANHRELLDEARHAPRETIDRIVARFQLPKRSPTRVVVQPVPDVRRERNPGIDAGLDLFDGTHREIVSMAVGPATDAVLAADPAPSDRSATAWRLHMTLDEPAHRDLERLQELMRHQVPDGDPAVIVARALALLREQVERRQLGRRRAADRKESRERRRDVGRVASTRVDRAAESGGERHSRPSRHIPADVRREVAARDADRCAFVTADGRRCGELNWLEFHHLVPHARGGRAIPGNLELRCRAHNRYEGERDFDGFVRERTSGYRSVRRSAGVEPSCHAGDRARAHTGTSVSSLPSGTFTRKSHLNPNPVRRTVRL